MALAKNVVPGEKGKLTRNRLVVHGFSLFMKGGVADVSLDDILQYSGVKKGVFYYYFDSKEAFLHACFEECYLQPVGEVLRDFYAEEPCSIADILYFFNHFAIRVKEKMDALMGDCAVELDDVYSNISYMSRKDNFMAAHYFDFHERQRLYVERCLVNMRNKGLVDPDADCKELAKMMCCCREGAFMMWSKQKREDFAGTMTAFMRYFEQLLGPRPA
ncbi:MAG: TetR/AcrR family transcriptional regulator [Spirochaetaceae bacterium]|jgi:AcrR family transcriptional regulator|nr:TetR/AcrR family transcriptional regulator [Spirochaetaceae bacterium]